MKINIKLSSEEMSLAKSYARIHGITLEDAFKSALFEKIEDAYDSAVASDALTEFKESGEKSSPIKKLWEALDI